MATRPLITPLNWQNYKKEVGDSSFLEYVYASESIVEKLDSIIKVSKNFKELQEQLTAFRDERKKFVRHARNN